MGVERHEIGIHEFNRLYGRRCVRRWQLTGVHLSRQHTIQLGWTFKGAWWVEDSRYRHAWVFTGDGQRETRAAAQALCDWLRGQLAPGDERGTWRPIVAEYTGRQPNEAAAVPDWPPGLGPSDAPDEG